VESVILTEIFLRQLYQPHDTLWIRSARPSSIAWSLTGSGVWPGADDLETVGVRWVSARRALRSKVWTGIF